MSEILYVKAQSFIPWTIVEASNQDFTVSLFEVFGSPTGRGRFLYIIPEGFEIGGNFNTVLFGNPAAFQSGRALATSKTNEPLFPTGSRLRIWVKPGAFVRGGGGRGGFGGCETDGGQDERMGGGGGGAGFWGARLGDEPDISATGGLNRCNVFDTSLHGGPGTRTTGGAGSNSVTLLPGSIAGTNGAVGTSAIWLRESAEIINEGSIYGGGGGGGGADSEALGNRSFPGDGGTPGVAGEDATIRSGNPSLTSGGAAGEAVLKDPGATVTFIANHPEGEPGDPGDVLGSI